MKLSVIILNYNVRYFLELCLKSVQQAIKTIDAEIILVDNNSKDDSCQMVKDLFPEVILIENKENSGFSKGNNIGFESAKGEYICILNPDTVLPEDIFVKLFGFSLSIKNLGIVGCKLINGRGEFLPESKRNIPFVKAAVKKILGDTSDYYATHLKDNETGKVSVLVGAFMFMKYDVFNAVNGFDEDYFMYGEDIDLSYKILKAGYDNYYYADATLIHFKGESTLRDKLYAKRFYGAMQIFYQKHFKRHVIFNLLVWFGIRMVYFFRKIPVINRKKVERFFFISNEMNPELKKTLKSEVILKSSLDEKLPNNSEIIFDNNVLAFKDIIQKIELLSENRLVTFKILPKDSNFIIGSDNAISRGEILNFK
ncbi:MAG: glycosyltransferase family 2 protein [Flavobacteriaceae bacterium]|nr:glycosyltransferase family 2 protein [Flavobacteriaceae bacterium]